MASGDEEGGRAKSRQLNFDFMASLDERGKLEALVHRYADGAIEFDELVRRFEVQHQLTMGAALRALRIVDSKAARAIVDRITADISAASPGKPARASVDGRARNKGTDALLREAVIFGMLKRSDQELTADELWAAIGPYSENFSQPAMISQLDRLIKDSLITRVRKGRYTRSKLSSAYFDEVEREILARDVALPKIPAG